MATRHRRSMQAGEESIIDILSCSICLEAYDDETHQPKLLPCHHSFCKMCLVYLAANHTYVDCPTCRKRTILGNLAPEGILALQTNFYINQMREFMADDSKIKTKGCKKHGKNFSHFCSSCELQICAECCTIDHNEASGHTVLDINRARLEQRHLLEVEIAEAQETILAAQPRVTKLETERDCLFAAYKKTEEEIKREFALFIEDIIARKDKLKEDMKQIFRHKRRQLNETMTTYSKQADSLEGLLGHCHEAMSAGTVTDIIAYRTKLASKNQEYRHERITNEAENYITFDCEDMQHDFRSMVQVLGNLTVHGPLPATVKVFDMPLIAGLYSNISFEVRAQNGEPLADYPITVEVVDSYDDAIPCMTSHRGNGRYEFTLRPMISGLHRMKVLFMEQAIDGFSKNLNVLSNNPVALIGGKIPETEGSMEYPRAVAVHSDGSIYCVDTGNNRIQVFDKKGDFLFAFPISHESQKFSSCGIAINREQNVVICPEVKMNEADITGADTLLLFSTNGQLLHRLAFPEALNKALCVATNSMGHMILADFDANMIFILDRHGKRLLRKFGEQGSGPGQFDHPTFVCVGEDDTIIVADGDNHRIQVFDKAGKFLYKFGSKGNGKAEFNMPFGVATDNHGNILVVDGQNKRIQVFKTGGEFVFCIESLGDKLNAPRGIAVTSDGHVLVADRDNHCIKKFKYLHSTLL